MHSWLCIFYFDNNKKKQVASHNYKQLFYMDLFILKKIKHQYCKKSWQQSDRNLKIELINRASEKKTIPPLNKDFSRKKALSDETVVGIS